MSREFCSVVETNCVAAPAFRTGLGYYAAHSGSKVATRCFKCGDVVCTACSRVVEGRRRCLNCFPELAALLNPEGTTMSKKKKKSVIAAETAAYYDAVKQSVAARQGSRTPTATPLENIEAVIAKSGVSFDIGLISRIRLDGGTMEQRKFIVERLTALWNASRKP